MTVKVTPLSDRCRALILGTLLGDGSLSLSKPYTNARLSFKHSVKQESYFMWKVSQVGEISSEKCMWKQSGKSEGFGSEKIRYQSKALESLTELYKLTYKRGRKLITRKWLNQLTPLSLAVWWMDDGSLVSNTRRGVFCTDSCSLKEVKIIQKYLQKVWGIITHISKTVRSKKDGRTVVYLRLNIRSSEYLMKFLRIVLPYVSVKAMLYKFLLIYKDSEIQQRWISEVSSLSGFDKNSIQEIVNYRKSKLKVFQRKI